MSDIENFTLYIPKALFSIFLLMAPWMENIDWGIKVGATLMGLIIGVLTGIRIYHDIKIRISQRKERELRNRILEEQIRRDYEDK
jgi:membrane associated rhomboid family serine protease